MKRNINLSVLNADKALEKVRVHNAYWVPTQLCNFHRVPKQVAKRSDRGFWIDYWRTHTHTRARARAHTHTAETKLLQSISYK